jgi:hypothetical protein
MARLKLAGLIDHLHADFERAVTTAVREARAAERRGQPPSQPAFRAFRLALVRRYPKGVSIPDPYVQTNRGTSGVAAAKYRDLIPNADADE